MYFLISIPIILTSFLIIFACKKQKMVIIPLICKGLIIVSMIFFVYSYAAYYGYDMIKMITDFVTNLF